MDPSHLSGCIIRLLRAVKLSRLNDPQNTPNPELVDELNKVLQNGSYDALVHFTSSADGLKRLNTLVGIFS